MPQLFGRKCGAPDGITCCELLDRSLDRLRLIFERALTDTADAFVGLDERKDAVAPAHAHYEGRHLGDAAGAGVAPHICH